MPRTVSATFVSVKETKGTWVMEEQTAVGQAPVVGQLYIKKYQMPKTFALGVPVKVTLELPDDPSTAPATSAPVAKKGK